MPPQVDDEMLPSEATSLLGTRPSAHSTDFPTRTSFSDAVPLASSYNDLSQSVELQLKSLNDVSKAKKEAVVPNKKALNKQHAILILMLGCALSIILVSVVHYKTTSGHMHPSGGSSASRRPAIPFSTLDPVLDLNLPSFDRAKETSPPKGLFLNRPEKVGSTDHRGVIPTNAWYQNLLMVRGEPSNLQRAYSTPYLLDMVGRIPGLRAHRNHVLASTSVMQLTFSEANGVTLGAAPKLSEEMSLKDLPHRYSVVETTELGVTLQWDIMKMVSTIVRGMPYTTMEYLERETTSESGDKIFPTISSALELSRDPLLDGKSKLDCSKKGAKALVTREMELHFTESDFTWLVFFSEPVWLKCELLDGTLIQVVGSEVEASKDEEAQPLIIRAALLDACTTGRNQLLCREGLGDMLPEEKQVKEYAEILRQYAPYYPGQKNCVSFVIEDDATQGDLILDWDVQVFPTLANNDTDSIAHQSLRKLETQEELNLIMFALPHHVDLFGSAGRPNGIKYCRTSLHGPTCIVEGAIWTLKENLPRIGLQAARPPRAEFLPALAKAVREDLNYSLPDFFERGAGDTYFSGKMISKLARILLISEELVDICEGRVDVADTEDYEAACENVTLPSPEAQQDAIDRLRRSVEVWINGTGETPFVYDEGWGGVVSCGCDFNGTACNNHYPDCPAFSDQGLNFGNAFYNDQHFHYGYHIHGAAVVAHFDPDWGKKHFEQVLLLIRNIANPSKDDTAFPLFRHKDWYQGSSWASGVPLPPYLNGKNQESSSEAIAAYESVALFGQVMNKIWSTDRKAKEAAVSKEVLKVGQLMTATEIRSAQKYWHIKLKNKNETVVPIAYTNNVVGILWSTMAQFGTWFGAAPYLPYGIQLLPITPISEERDEMDWVNEMYYPFSRACADFHQCTESGWAILQVAILATVGYPEHAADRVKELLPDSYENAGGNGQSKSNTLWYIATRPVVERPVEMDQSDVRGQDDKHPAPVFTLTDCYNAETCTADVLDRQAGAFTCRDRIDWLIHSMDKSQWDACSSVGAEFPDACGPCVPGPKSNNQTSSDASDTHKDDKDTLHCDACTLEECNSPLNRCPALDRTFVCTHGPSKGGCSSSPWTLGHEQCRACCEMTDCQSLRDHESKKITKDGTGLDKPVCPPCKPSICYGSVNQCPIHTAPYICLNGNSAGGCSSTPWDVHSSEGQCTECCEITVTC